MFPCLVAIYFIFETPVLWMHSKRAASAGGARAQVGRHRGHGLQPDPAKPPHEPGRGVDAIVQIAGHVQRPQDAACLQRHADMIIRRAREAVPEVDDVAAAEARFIGVILALGEQCG